MVIPLLLSITEDKNSQDCSSRKRNFEETCQRDDRMEGAQILREPAELWQYLEF